MIMSESSSMGKEGNHSIKTRCSLLIARRRLRGHACLYSSSRPEGECRWQRQRVENTEFAVIILWWCILVMEHTVTWYRTGLK